VTAGVPGLGLSGLFLVASVLVMPLLRRRPGEVRPTRRRALVVLAVAIAAATWGTWALVAGAVGAGREGARAAGLGGTHAGVPALLVSIAIVALILAVTEILALVLRPRPTPTEPPITPIHRSGPTPGPNRPASGIPGAEG